MRGGVRHAASEDLLLRPGDLSLVVIVENGHGETWRVLPSSTTFDSEDMHI